MNIFRRAQNPGSGFHGLYAYFLILNYTLGSGFLAIPLSFAKSGILVAIVTFSIVVFIVAVCTVWALEALGRIHVIENEIPHVDDLDVNLSISNLSSIQKRSFTLDLNCRNIYLIPSEKKYEINEISKILFNKWIFYLITLVVCLSTTLTLWPFSTVVGSLLATNIKVNSSVFSTCSEQQFAKLAPNNAKCYNLYRICVASYGIVGIFLTLIGIVNQRHLQLFLGFMRFIALLGMSLFAFVKIILDCPHTLSCTHHYISGNASSPYSFQDIDNSTQNDYQIQLLYHFDFIEWIRSVPIYFFAAQNLCIIPSAVFYTRNKHSFKFIVVSVFFSIWLILIIFGILVCFAFPYSINGNTALNWLQYTHTSYNVVIRIISYFFLFLPVFDLVSAFPLLCIVSCNSLFNLIFCNDTSKISNMRQRIGLVVLKLIVSIIPLILSLFIVNFITTMVFISILGYFLLILFPTLYQCQSQRLCERINPTGELRIRSHARDFTGKQRIYYGLNAIRLYLFKSVAKTPYSGCTSNRFSYICMFVLFPIILCIGIASAFISVLYVQ